MEVRICDTKFQSTVKHNSSGVHVWCAIRNKIQIAYGNHVSLQGHHDVFIRQEKKVKQGAVPVPSPNPFP